MPHRHFPFVVLEIEAENLQRAGSFYSTIFGWSFTESAIELGSLEADMGADHDTTVRVHLRARHPLPRLGAPIGRAAPAHAHSLCVHDLSPILAGVVAAGGQLIAGPVDVPGLGRRLYVRDTEGNEVAILEPSHESH
jgi:predicted enzyme related to lactoylglutathione lyase